MYLSKGELDKPILFFHKMKFKDSITIHAELDFMQVVLNFKTELIHLYKSHVDTYLMYLRFSNFY